MYAERYTLDLTVDASGDATVYTPVVTGRVLALRLVIPGSGGLDAGADITITGESTGIAILALTNQGGSSATYMPRQPVHGPTGTALTYDATQAVAEPPIVVNERIKVVVAQGGVSKAGTLHVIVG